MWTLFKIINFFWLMTATAIWPMSLFNQGPILLVVDTILIVLMSFLPIRINLNLRTGILVAIILGLVSWSTYINGPVYGAITTLQFLIVLILIQLPYAYLKELLYFTIKWFAILLIPSLLLYWTLIFIDLPSFGTFVHPVYEPFNNYIFYIKSTWDNGIFPRFNAFLLEPGHLALLSTFLTIACRYRYKENKWLIILGISTLFSFSLAGYLLYTIGWLLLKINSVGKALLASTLLIAAIIGAIGFGGGDNAVNKLILERLERDEHAGIKGNNRFTDSTDFIYKQAVEKGKAWTGVKNETVMENVKGAGYKIFVINNGFIGIILALLFYIAVIPSDPDYRYTISYLIVLALCFIQRSAPEMYHWLFPYVTGIYLAKYEKERRLDDSLLSDEQ
ncbi:MAG: hypothetical protein K2N25_08580 [Muribaculaceae bacterium]|nr:hypothetical protein [Muribaculaceae bacterium]